jgi:glycosyltransferase involved in cell wall biosynthesis
MNEQSENFLTLLNCQECKDWCKVENFKCKVCGKSFSNIKPISFAIPSLHECPKALSCIPKNTEVVISNWKTNNHLISSKSVARNIAAYNSHGKILIFIDDDVEFSSSFLESIISSIKDGTIAGLKQKEKYNNYIITRFLGMTRNDFIMSGGFDTFMIPEDLEFSYRLRAMGFKLKYFPEDSVRRLDDKPPSDFMSLVHYMKTQNILALRYKEYVKRVPRAIIEYFYRHLRGDFRKGNRRYKF